MIDLDTIESIKSPCMTIGLRKKGEKYPSEIQGTGFCIDPDGFVLTAKHVIDGIKHRIGVLATKMLEEEGLYKKDLSEEELLIYEKKFESYKTIYEITATFTEIKDNSIRMTTTSISERRSIFLQIDGLDDYLPKEHDVTICRIYGEWGDLPYLKLKPPAKLDVYSDVFICGFPRGLGTFNPFDVRSGKRFSPIIQTGKISSLMPSDKSSKPFGLFTDVIGVGGSSGSPIIDARTNEVLGIAQNIVGANVFDKVLEPIGTAGIGVIWGVTMYFLYGPLLKMIEAMKKVTTKKGEPLLGKDDAIKLTMTVGESLSPKVMGYEIVKKSDIPGYVENS